MAFWRKRNGLKGSLVHPDRQNKKLSATAQRRVLIEEMLAANGSLFSETDKKILNSLLGDQNQPKEWVNPMFKNTIYSDNESREVHGDMPCNFNEDRNARWDQWDESGTEKLETSFSDHYPPENRNQRNQFRGETQGVNLFNPQRSAFIQERSPGQDPPENRNQRNQFRGETQGVNLFNPQRSSFIRERNPLNSERSSLDNNLSGPQRRRMVIEEILAANSSLFSEAHKKTLNSHFSVEDCVRGPFKNTAYSDKESRVVCGDLPYNFDEERRNHEDWNVKNVSGTSFWSNNRNERNQLHPETRDVSPFNPQRSPLISEKSPLSLERSSLEQYGSSNNQQAKNVSGSSFWPKSRFERNEFRPETRDISPVNPQRNPIIPERSTLNFKRGSLEQYGSPNNQEAKNVSGSSFWSENRFERNQLSPKTRDVSPKVNPQRSLFIPETNPLNRERSFLEQYGSSNNQQQRNQFRFDTREVSLLNPQRSPFIRERSPLNSERNSLEQYRSSSNQQDARNISVERRTFLEEIIDFESPQDHSGNGIAPLMTQSTQDNSGNNIEILDFKPPQDNSGNGIAPSKGNNFGPIPRGCIRVKMWIDKGICFSDPTRIVKQLSQQNPALRTKLWTVLHVKNNPRTGSTFLVQIKESDLTVLQNFNMAPYIHKKKTKFTVLQPGEEF